MPRTKTSALENRARLENKGVHFCDACNVTIGRKRHKKSLFCKNRMCRRFRKPVRNA